MEVRKAFERYISRYDLDDPKISLKVKHTYRVASLCIRIAASAGLEWDDVDLAWLCGMLHDIGRFEQIAQYHTFQDAQSIGHAELGARILFGDADQDELVQSEPGEDDPSKPLASIAGTGHQENLGGCIRQFIDNPEEDQLIRTVVALHSSYRLPPDLDERTRTYCNILRDADKIDILKVNCEDSCQTIYGVSESEMDASPVSESALAAFREHRTVMRGERSYPADYMVGHICFIYELVYPKSLELACEQGYVFQMLGRKFTNPETLDTFSRMKSDLRRWIAAERSKNIVNVPENDKRSAHGQHTRLPKNFVLRERLDTYSRVIIADPCEHAGSWREFGAVLAKGASDAAQSTPSSSPAGTSPSVPDGASPSVPDGASPSAPTSTRFDSVKIDLGCGKGAFLVKSAALHPGTLFIGIDNNPVTIACTAKLIHEKGLRNALVVPAHGDDIVYMFGNSEVQTIYLNFPTPFPRKKDAHLRLVLLDRFMEYCRFLAPGGTIRLKTDSQPLRDFSLTQFDLAGYRIICNTDDAREVFADDPVSGYEARLVSKGAKVLGVEATPGPMPAHVEQTAQLGLVNYLPDNIDSVEYAPLGMEGTVQNIKNRKAKKSGRKK